MFSALKNIWDLSVKWRQIGVIALVVGVIFGTLLLPFLVAPTEKVKTFSYVIIILYVFVMWLSITFLGAVAVGAVDVTRSPFRSRHQVPCAFCSALAVALGLTPMDLRHAGIIRDGQMVRHLRGCPG